MFVSEAGCLFMCFLCISVTETKPNSICALKGSSVNLTCSAPCPHTNKTWFIVYKNVAKFVYHELTADDGKYRISDEILTINDLTERDENLYCCCEHSEDQKLETKSDAIRLRVTDVQVKMFPASEGLKVTLMCTTSCSLTDSPAAFIWYQNTEFLYEDWSPWYQDLVSGDNSVRYSCAVKGYEELRAPDVSVGLVTSTCFSVTYSEGGTCSNHQTSETQSCSITFPRDLHVERTNNTGHVKLSCKSSCPLTEPLTSFKWYKNRKMDRHRDKLQILSPPSFPDSFFCSLKDLEDLFSAEVCVSGTNCWSVNYISSRRICALKGSSVNISSKYTHPEHQLVKDKRWYKVKVNAEQDEEQLTEVKDKVEFQDMTNQHILRLNNLQMKDTAEYKFEAEGRLKQTGFSGVTLTVTDIRVDVGPAAEVTEGQRVTLTCRTSCPLTENTNYIWYFNRQPLTTRQNKQLILDAVSSQDAGNYSCAVRSDRLIISAVTTLTVQSLTGTWKPAAAGASVLLLIVINVLLLKLCFANEVTNDSEQVTSQIIYKSISAQPAAEETFHLDNYPDVDRGHLYSGVQPLQHQKPEDFNLFYSVVDFRTRSLQTDQ